MDDMVMSVKDLKKLSSYSGSLKQFKSSKELVEVCRRNSLIADIKDPAQINKGSFDDYFTHLCALTKQYLFEHRELKVWDKFASSAECKKVAKIFHEIGIARSSGLFSDGEDEEYDPLIPNSKRVTLEELYEVYSLKYNFNGSLQSFKRQITRMYGSYAEYCLQKGYDINTTKWDSEETAIRVARKLGSLSEIERKSPSLLKYLDERNLTKRIFNEEAA